MLQANIENDARMKNNFVISTAAARRAGTRSGETCVASARARVQAGFTLVELLIVMTIIAILMAIAIPRYQASVKSAREASLHEDLQVMRQAIDTYTMDKQKAPQSLDDLVQAGYLRSVPNDPMTRQNSTWQTTTDDTLMSPDQTDPGITDVHSGSTEAASDGSQYSSW
jgi:general secretion pathway protein G